MLKTGQFKTQYKGDSHSSKTPNVFILLGLMIKQANAITCTSEIVFKFNCIDVG